MATKPPKSTQLAPVIDEDLYSFGSRSMKTYGTEVNENRAIPCLQDGLKPVVRRLLWSAVRIAQRQTKTARLVGDCMGAYHPHGDSSIAGACATMVQDPTPVLYGEGNWGSPLDNPAAMRYTELYLSVYGKQLLQSDYLAVTSMCPNYDDKEKEPVFLPSLMPNVLINDTEGIGLGVTSKIPSFTPVSVLDVMIRMLSGEQLTPLDFARSLKFHQTWGGTVEYTKENKAAILSMMTSEQATTVAFSSPLQIEREAKRITINRFAPNLNLDKLILTLRTNSLIKAVHAGKDLSYIVQVNPAVNFNDFDKLVLRIKRLTETKMRYRIYVADRVPLEVEEGEPARYETTFKSYSVPMLLLTWMKFRVNLERQVIEYRIAQAEAQLHRHEIFMLAYPHIDFIIKCVRTMDDPVPAIAKKLQITDEDVKVILSIRIGQLSRLDESELAKKIKDVKARILDLQKQLKKPSRNVLAYFIAAKEAFVLNDKRQPGCEQWSLTKNPALAGALAEGDESNVLNKD